MATTELGIGSSDAGHRKSNRPEEYVGYTQVQPVGSEPITKYVLDTAQPGHHPGEAIPVLQNPHTGLDVVPRSEFVLPTASAADYWDETQIISTQGTSQQEIWVGSRPSSVTRWISTFDTPYSIGPVNWFVSDGVQGFGIGLHSNERFLEDRGNVAFSFANPTHGGAARLPSRLPESGDELVSPVSPPIHFEYGTGSQAYCEGAVWPYEFDDFSQKAAGDGYTNHGHTATRKTLWWRHRQYQLTEMHYGGREFIHAVTGWFYTPYAFDFSEFGAPIPSGSEGVGYNTIYNGLGFQDLPMDKAYTWDMAAETPTEVSGWDTATTGEGSIWVVEQNAMTTSGEIGDGTLPAPFDANGYGACIYRRTSDDFCVATAVKLGPPGGGVTIDRVGRDFGVNRIQMKERLGADRGPSYPDHLSSWRYSLVSIGASIRGRNAFWIGHRCYYFVGPWSQVQEACLELKTSGLLDTYPDPMNMPASVRAETDIADPTGGTGTGLGFTGTGVTPTTGFPGGGASAGGATQQAVQGVVGTGRYAGNYLKYASRLL